MMRMRRYRVFLIAVTSVILLIVLISGSLQWDAPLDSIQPFSQQSRVQDEQSSSHSIPDQGLPLREPTVDDKGQVTEYLNTNAASKDATALKDFPQIKLPGSQDKSEDAYIIPEPVLQHPKPPPKVQVEKTPDQPVGSKTEHIIPAGEPALSDKFAHQASSEQVPEVVHWAPQPETYPPSSTIQLPTGKPTAIPRIQAKFGAEDPARQKGREARRDIIKRAFKKHWTNYKKYAWGHDELQPISQSFKDPFAGWGATLVDSLDTLWIMGLKEEFDEAVEATGKIDFTTTSVKDDLPLFEVTIRYLGGLLSAYDLSGAKYKVLLDKALELGEILYGAFDTENRMPMTYFKWKPSDRKSRHTAARSVVLAELGTLSMEFTRLSQLSKQPKYYDAVARITDALYELQNRTALPGMWPLFIDATGCKRKSTTRGQKYNNGKPWGGALPKKEQVESSSGEQGATGLDTNVPSVPDTLGNLAKPQAGVPQKGDVNAKDSMRAGVLDRREIEKAQCEQVGLQSASGYQDTFTLGGMADSVYEYLPKEYLLLGIGNRQYREMHEAAMDPIKNYTLYRPMIPDEKRSLRFTGKFKTEWDASEKDEQGKIKGKLDPSTGHLSCFIGAVVGLGAKIFDRPDEIELAEQLTDGCVWAYEITASGIMAEDITPVPCESMDTCKWNETRWLHEVEPMAEQLLASQWRFYNEQLELYEQQNQQKKNTTKEVEVSIADILEPPKLPIPEVKLTDLDEGKKVKREVDERQLNGEDLEEFTGSAEDVAKDTIPAKQSSSIKSKSSTTSTSTAKATGTTTTTSTSNPEYQPEMLPPVPIMNMPEKPKTLSEYYQERVTDQRLSEGIARWGGRNYILRPEAIESVFYLYRITGDTKWQEKGWKMWQAIDKHTVVEHGNSAILDVTSVAPKHLDSAESFWTGETLKYFYLLYSEPDLVSLDDYVFNTEAHPFLRPDAKLKKRPST